MPFKILHSVQKTISLATGSLLGDGDLRDAYLQEEWRIIHIKLLEKYASALSEFLGTIKGKSLVGCLLWVELG